MTNAEQTADTAAEIRDYLDSLEWDGVPRLDGLLADYFGATGAPEYLEAVGRSWLLSAIQRVREPGCHLDLTVVLVGEQGCGKSLTVRLLFGQRYKGEALGPLPSKEFPYNLTGCWAVEIPELQAYNGAEIRRLAIDTQVSIDTFRPLYSQYSKPFPRCCVFVGTTNDAAYLRRIAGRPLWGMRFAPVQCAPTEASRRHLARDRDQLWAEADFRYLQGERPDRRIDIPEATAPAPSVGDKSTSPTVCADCRYFQAGDPRSLDNHSRCLRNAARDSITGVPRTCRDVRGRAGPCGPNGRLFAPADAPLRDGSADVLAGTDDPLRHQVG